jgi:hypothetical protein
VGVLTTIGTAVGATTAATAVGAAVVAGGALAVGGTVASVNSAKRSAGAARAAANEQIRANKLTASRQRRQSIRAFLSQRASLAAANRASGIQTSAAAGGLGSMSSQFGANLGFSSQLTGINNNITRLSGIQSTQAAMSGMYGNIANFGMQLMGSAGTIGNMFPAKPSTKIPMSKTDPFTDVNGYGVG